MMPFPDLELLRTRIEDLHRRAERERRVNEALGSRPRPDRLRAALAYARSGWSRVRSRVRLEAPNDQIHPEFEPPFRIAPEQNVDRSDGAAESVCR